MPTFSSANFLIELTPAGGVRVRPAGGGPFVDYPDMAAVLMERPQWLNAQTMPMLAAVERKPTADVNRFIGERPEEMSRQSYRLLDEHFRRHHAFDELSRDTLIRGASVTSGRYLARHGMVLALPAFLACAGGPQFAFIGQSVAGMPVLKDTFDTIDEGLAVLPPPMQADLLRNVAPLQARYATSLGLNSPAVAGLDRWVAERSTGISGVQSSTMFDGRYLGSTPYGKTGLSLHQFELAPRPENGMSTLARVIGGEIDPSARTIAGARSTLGINEARTQQGEMSGPMGDVVAAIEQNTVLVYDEMMAQQQRVLPQLVNSRFQGIGGR